jgi:mono/diheme cytochrome c family protein
MHRAGVPLLCVLLVFVLAGCLDAEDKKPLPESVQGTVSTTTTTSTTTTAAPSGGKGDATAGKQVFMSAGCTSCHTLADAGAKGTVGPNLDDAKPPFDLVVDRVTNGKGVMPSFKGQLSVKEIQDVAAYVSSVAGKS